MTYHIPWQAAGETQMAVFSGWSGTALGLRLNGDAERIIAWPPYEAALTPECGKNDLAVTVYGHRRNALGPFYLAAKPYLVTPRSFRTYETAEKQLVPCGL